jgi:hypothetical protein
MDLTSASLGTCMAVKGNYNKHLNAASRVSLQVSRESYGRLAIGIEPSPGRSTQWKLVWLER